MPADELGGGMDDEVGAMLKGAAQVGRGKGVVDQQGDAIFLPDLSHLIKGKDVNQRVAQGLAVQDLGVRADGAAEVLRVAGIHQGDLDAQAGEGVGELVVGAAVQGGGRHDMVARPRQGEDRLRLGSMPRADRQRPATPLQGGDALLEDIAGRVHDASIDIAALLQGE